MHVDIKVIRDSDVDLCLEQRECAVISDTVATANEGVLADHLGSLSGYGWAAGSFSTMCVIVLFLPCRRSSKVNHDPRKTFGH